MNTFIKDRAINEILGLKCFLKFLKDKVIKGNLLFQIDSSNFSSVTVSIFYYHLYYKISQFVNVAPYELNISLRILIHLYANISCV